MEKAKKIDALSGKEIIYDRPRLDIIISEISTLQFRKALRALNRMTAFKTYFESLSDEQEDEWVYNPRVHIKSDKVKHMVETMNINAKQLQDLFNKAAEF